MEAADVENIGCVTIWFERGLAGDVDASADIGGERRANVGQRCQDAFAGRVDIELAVDDPTNAQGYKTWQAHYDEIINKDVADRYGFFFYVSEFKLFELSAVLWGSNDLTGIIEPGKTTHEDSRKSTIDKS